MPGFSYPTRDVHPEQHYCLLSREAIPHAERNSSSCSLPRARHRGGCHGFDRLRFADPTLRGLWVLAVGQVRDRVARVDVHAGVGPAAQQRRDDGHPTSGWEMPGRVRPLMQDTDDFHGVVEYPVINHMPFDASGTTAKEEARPEFADLGKASQGFDGIREGCLVATALLCSPFLHGVEQDISQVVLGVGRDDDRPVRGRHQIWDARRGGSAPPHPAGSGS